MAKAQGEDRAMIWLLSPDYFRAELTKKLKGEDT